MPTKSIGIFTIVGVGAFMFANGLLLSTYAMITLALESERFAAACPQLGLSETALLTAFLGLAGVSQLICPLVGLLSDRTRSRWGKRRPFIGIGLAMGTAGLLCQWWARSSLELHAELSLAAYAVAFVVSMLALNLIYTGAAGLVADMVPPRQTGLANGIVTLLQVAGSCFGFLCYFVAADLSLLYELYVVVVIVTSLATLLAADDPPAFVPTTTSAYVRVSSHEMDECDGVSRGDDKHNDGDVSPFIGYGDDGYKKQDPLMRPASPYIRGTSKGESNNSDIEEEAGGGGQQEIIKPFTYAELWAAYAVSPRSPKDAEFFWVFVSRTLYYMGGSANAFVQYFLRDRVRLPPTGQLSDPARCVCMMAFVGYLAGMAGAVPGGKLSDRWGRKPLVSFSCAVMATSCIALVFVDDVTSVLVIGTFGGLGNGIYMSVDLALAIDTIPDASESARYLGVWGVAAFVGACLGPLIGGPLLYIFGQMGQSTDAAALTQHPIQHGSAAAGGTEPSSLYGYVALFLFGSVCLTSSALVLHAKVKNAR